MVASFAGGKHLLTEAKHAAMPSFALLKDAHGIFQQAVCFDFYNVYVIHVYHLVGSETCCLKISRNHCAKSKLKFVCSGVHTLFPSIDSNGIRKGWDMIVD